MKFKELFEETKNKIDLQNKDHKGLLNWVKDYIIARHYRNLKLAKQLKQDIDKKIKKLNLNKKNVYFYYGDPDDPNQNKKIMKSFGITD